ncbi:MAG: hypothetical protein CBR30_06745 [Dictyoglomus sp. NZ13-RE01]|nr:MAG: hypothetical protein CBR30_06745 [Dictyoglomus sp. NZ13-RE01]
MKKGIILIIFLLLLINISASSIISTKNDESIYVLLNYDGKVKKVDLVNWIEINGNGNFSIVKDGKYLKDIRLYNEDTKVSVSQGKIIIQGNAQGHKNIYLTGTLNKKLPLEFSITYKYNGKIAKPESFVGKSGDLEIDVNIKTLEDLPFRVVMSCEFSADDFVLKNLEDFMVMVLGKTVRLTGITYPIPKGEIKLLISGKKLKVPAFTFTALPSIPPVDLSIKDQIKNFSDGLEGFLLLNQAHQKILKGILEGFEKQTPSIPQEFLTLPFTLVSYQNKAYLLSRNIKNYPQNFSKLYEFIKNKAEDKEDKDWQTALNMAENVKKEIEESRFSDDAKEIGDFLKDLSFQSQKAMSMLTTSLEGIQKIEELLNIMLYGGEIEGKKIPGLVDTEKEIKKVSGKLKENLNTLQKGEEKIKSWEKKLEDYNFAGKIEGAKSVVRFYYRIEEIK